MDIPDYLVDFHRSARRQGPGSDASTRRALAAVPNRQSMETILDLGCGTGAQSLVLAKQTAAQITAVDILRPFLEELGIRAARLGLEDRITTVEASIDDLGFDEHSVDLLWSEGSAYIIGFERALGYWRQFIAHGGAMVVSDLCWLTDTRPPDVEAYWAKGYPDISTVAERLRMIEATGYRCITHFALPPQGWTEEYYTPIRERSSAFLKTHGQDAEVKAFINSGLEEADIYDQFGAHYSYVYFVLTPRATG